MPIDDRFISLPKEYESQTTQSLPDDRFISLPGEYKKSKVQVTKSNLDIATQKKFYDTSRTYFEHGQLPLTALLIPGHQNMLEAPRPPGGFDKSGKPLDESGKPYKVKSFPRWLRRATSSAYTGVKSIANALGTEVADISVDLYNAIDETLSKHPIASKVLEQTVAIPETFMSIGSGILSTVASEGVKQVLIAEGMDRDDAIELAARKASRTTYQPYTEGGQVLAEISSKILGFPFEAAHKLVGEPVKQMVEESVVGDFIRWLKGKPEMFGETIDTAITFYLGGKGLHVGGKSVKEAGKRIKTVLEAKRIEKYGKFIPSEVPPTTPITVPDPPIPKPVMPIYRYVSDKVLKDPKYRAVEEAKAKIHESGKEIDTDAVEEARARIEEITQIRDELSNKGEVVKTVIDTTPEEIIKEELKIKGDKVKGIKKGKVRPITLENVDAEGVEVTNRFKIAAAEKGKVEKIAKAEKLEIVSEIEPKELEETKPLHSQDPFSITNPLARHNALVDESIRLGRKERIGTATPEDLAMKARIDEALEPPPKHVRTKEDIKAELEEFNQELGDLQKDLMDAVGDKEAQADIRESIRDTKAEINSLTKELKKPTAKTSELKPLTAKYITTFEEINLLEELDILGKKLNNKEIKPGEYIKEKKRIQSLIDAEEAAKELEIVTDLDELTGTPKPKGLDTDLSPFRDRDVKHTNTLSKLFNEKVKSVSSSPETYARYLINEVNRYLNGEKVDINKIRDDLSELSTRADELGRHFNNLEEFYSWKDTVTEAAKWAREADRLKFEQTDTFESYGNKLYMGLDPNEIYKRLKRLHPATYPKSIQQLMAKIANDLNIPSILDIFGGIGTIGRVKKYGFKGTVSAVEIEPMWGGRSTVEIQKERGVDNVIIGDSRNLNMLNNSVPAIFTSPTYGNLMALKSPSKLDSYQAFAGRVLQRGNTGGEVWGPTYEQLHKDIYKEAARVVQDGGYFVLNMKDKPVSAKDVKNNWIPKKGSTVEVVNGVMKATDWHVRALEEVGFVELKRYKVAESKSVVGSQKFGRQYTTGEENIVVMQKQVHTKFEQSNTKLYSGFPMDKETFIKLGQSAAKGMKAAQELKEFSTKTAAKLFRKQFTASLVERSGNTARILSTTPSNIGYRLKSSMYLTRGGHPKALRVFDQMRKEVDSGLSANEKYIKDGLIKFVRILDIAKYKPPGKFTFPKYSSPEEAAAYVAGFRYKKINGIRDLAPEEAHRLYHIREDGSVGGRVGAYFDWMRKAVKDAYEEGLITEQEMKNLTSHNYRKIKLVEIFDNKEEIKLGSKTLTVYDSGIERLKKGEYTDIYEPDSNIVALETFNTLYSRIFKNRANRELYDLALEDENNPFVRIKISRGTKIPEPFRHYTAKVFIDGKPKTLFLHDSIGSEWITSNAQTTYKYGQFVRYATGAPLVKTFATGVNQTFAFRNLPRDAFFLWFTSRVRRGEPSKVFGKYQSVFSPTLPVAAYQLLRQYKNVVKDTALRRGRLDDYIDDGGGMELLTPQGRMLFHGKHLEPASEAFYKFGGYLGTTSELMSRLAIREKVIEARAKEKGISIEEARKDKGIRNEATFAARDYMDFSQGGDIIKAVDNGIPYINAAIVAMRSFLRTFKDQPVVATYKIAQFAMLVSGLYIGNQALHPDTMKDLKGDRRTQGNLIFPLGDMFGFKDSMNETRYPFLMFPISQDMKFFKTLFEGGVDLMTGEDIDVDRIVQTLIDFAPADVTTLPPTISGALGYVMNKNFWLGKDIVPRAYDYKGPEWLTGKGGSGEEWNKDTPQAAIDIGKATGMSPERLRYLMGQLITNDNLYAQILGKAYQEAFGQLPQRDREFILAEALSKTPVIKAFFGITNPYTKFASSMEQARDKAELDNFIESRMLDILAEAYLYDKTVDRIEVNDYIYSFKDKNTRERLKDDFKFQENIQGLPNHLFWLGLKRISSVEERAKEYIKRINNATPKELDKIMIEEEPIVRRAGGILTNEFMQTVNRIRAESP